MVRGSLFLVCLTAAVAGGMYMSGFRPGEAKGCASQSEVDAYVAAFLARQPAQALAAGAGLDGALCTQEKVVAALSETFGPVVGYKAGLTSKPAQARFGADEPVRGVLYANMFRDPGAEVPAAFGARPLFEADLILVVGSEDINEALTPDEAIAHIAAVRPFIELPDLAYAPGEPITPATLTANGVAARLGVLGEEIPVDDPAAMLTALGEMVVTVTAEGGDVLAEAPGSSVLGNPAASVLWLRDNGVRFQAGDLISVGSIGPLLPPAKANGGASVTYAGLPGDPTLTVRFTDAE